MHKPFEVEKLVERMCHHLDIEAVHAAVSVRQADRRWCQVRSLPPPGCRLHCARLPMADGSAAALAEWLHRDPAPAGGRLAELLPRRSAAVGLGGLPGRSRQTLPQDRRRGRRLAGPACPGSLAMARRRRCVLRRHALRLRQTFGPSASAAAVTLAELAAQSGRRRSSRPRRRHSAADCSTTRPIGWPRGIAGGGQRASDRFRLSPAHARGRSSARANVLACVDRQPGSAGRRGDRTPLDACRRGARPPAWAATSADLADWLPPVGRPPGPAALENSFRGDPRTGKTRRAGRVRRRGGTRNQQPLDGHRRPGATLPPRGDRSRAPPRRWR